MPNIEYSLFRVKFIKPSQASLFTENLNPREFLLQAIDDKPSAELRTGYTWHIGNLSYFSLSSGYFAIGRTTSSTVEKFDEVSGNFVEEELEESPYTHCVFDSEIGIIGIAKKPNLSPYTTTIANNLEKLLSSVNVIKFSHITVQIRPIPDPDGFLKAISEAYRVFRFSATFRGPNPFDADAFFQKPLSVYLSSANGNKGKATISGDDLNRDVLVEVTRSSAATGNEASARIIKARNQKAVTINLKGDPVKRKYDEENHNPQFILADLLRTYHRIRHHDGNSDQ